MIVELLTLIRPHNNHSTNVSIHTVFLVSMSMTGVVMFIINVCLVKIYDGVNFQYSEMVVLQYCDEPRMAHFPLTGQK